MQPAWVVTVIVPVADDAASISDVGDTVYEHGALCVTVTVEPPMVIVPVRLAVPVFAATRYVAVPFPLPAEPVTVIHDAPLTAVHAQPTGAVTVMLPEPDNGVKDWLKGDAVAVHVPPDAVCVMVKVAPAIVSVPVRLLPVVF